MKEYICPLCGKSEDCKLIDTDNLLYKYYCSTYKKEFNVSTAIDDISEKEKLYYLIAEFLIRNDDICINGQNMPYSFYYSKDNINELPQYINLYNMRNNFPNKFMDKTARALVNLSIVFPEYKYPLQKDPSYYRIIFDKDERNETCYMGVMYDFLLELGYLAELENSYNLFFISSEGWKKIDELTINKKESNQGFIAMSFKDETKSIREAFRKAIIDSGYSVSIIDEKEHNNQIVPEIFHEIEKSKFVVVDVTFPNYGAYYEAGYAMALGKQVIMCCRKTEFDNGTTRPHFDVAQKSMVVWKDEEELIERLMKRIEATVR